MNNKDLLQKIESEIFETEDEVEKRLQTERLKDIYRMYNEEDRVISSIEANKNIQKLKKEEGSRLLIKSHYKSLDKIIDGFFPGNLITISAPTKQGKTLFCQNLTENFIKDDIKSLWFSYEVPMEEFLERFDIDVPLFYLPRMLKNNTLIWIEQRIIESVVKFNTKVIFIDHLHYVLDLAALQKNINVSLQIGSILRELKRMAIKWKVAIFLIAHIAKTTLDQPPTLADLRDSSFIAQESDIVLMIWRKVKEDSSPPILSNSAILSVQAHRRKGTTGNIPLTYVNGKLRETSEVVEEIGDNTDIIEKPGTNDSAKAEL